uniref:Uncharacterized protein n=1 Tax=Human herpesvirus 1 TaxID=10298 RepID=A0A2Z4H2H4_HHV1|nr:hypothetical protein [Human alphaherpesvirus 1]
MPTGHVEADGEKYTYLPGDLNRPRVANQVVDALCRCVMSSSVVGCRRAPTGGRGGGVSRGPLGWLAVATLSPRGNVRASGSGTAENVTQARERSNTEAVGLCKRPLRGATAGGGWAVGSTVMGAGRLAFGGRPSR